MSVGGQARELDGPRHRVPGLLAVGVGRHDVEPVRGDAGTHQPREDGGAASLCVLLGLDHQQRAALAEDESVAVPVEWATGALGDRRWWWTTRCASARSRRSAPPRSWSRRHRRSRRRPRRARSVATPARCLQTPKRRPRSGCTPRPWPCVRARPRRLPRSACTSAQRAVTPPEGPCRARPRRRRAAPRSTPCRCRSTPSGASGRPRVSRRAPTHACSAPSTSAAGTTGDAARSASARCRSPPAGVHRCGPEGRTARRMDRRAGGYHSARPAASARSFPRRLPAQSSSRIR